MRMNTEELAIVSKAVRMWEEAVKSAVLSNTASYTYTNHPRRMLRQLHLQGPLSQSLIPSL